MSEEKEFTIDKVSWHTKVADNPESPEMVRRRFKEVANFLERHGLTVRALLEPGQVPTDDFAIRSSDLTRDGLRVMKAGYDKWLKSIVNKKGDVSDLSILDQKLAEVRIQ